MKKKQIKNIWGWLNEITLYKTPINQIADNSWDSFNSYMVNRFISMNIEYCELAEYAQIFPYEEKEQLYNFYREMIPKKKVFLKYIKDQSKKKNGELIKILAEHFECSFREAEDYIDVLEKNIIKQILETRGIEEKEIKKLVK